MQIDKLLDLVPAAALHEQVAVMDAAARDLPPQLGVVGVARVGDEDVGALGGAGHGVHSQKPCAPLHGTGSSSTSTSARGEPSRNE